MLAVLLIDTGRKDQVSHLSSKLSPQPPTVHVNKKTSNLHEAEAILHLPANRNKRLQFHNTIDIKKTTLTSTQKGLAKLYQWQGIPIQQTQESGREG